MSMIKFEAIYQEHVWGGRGLSEKLNRLLPEGKVIGESWEIVDRDEAQSVVSSRTYKGLSLRELLVNHSDVVMGPNSDPSKPFPILVKWLDCQERLSLQVHPPASIAERLKGEPKTESWYVADTSKDASLILGLKKGSTREQFEALLEEGNLEDCCHSFPVDVGDSILVESGRMHAIDGGNLILEIQQNSDTTYRVYDWGRVGLDGQPRQLHVDESLQCIDFNDFEPSALKTAGGDSCQLLADCKEFKITKYRLNTGKSGLSYSANEQPRLLHVVEGSVKDLKSGDIVYKGENCLLAYGSNYELIAGLDCELLVTENFV